jgi:hypothetical protein
MSSSLFPPERPAVRLARHHVERAIYQLVTEALGGELVDWSPKGIGDTRWSTKVPEPTAGIRAALLVRQQANHMLERYLSRARGAGHSWADIAPLIGVTGAVTAFEALVPESNIIGYQRSTSWTCESCDEAIGDYGPYNGVADDERGHAPGCVRHAADIEAERRRWADTDESGDGDE